MKNKFYVAIKNEASTGTLELYFLDYIQDGFDWSTYEYKSMVQDTINQIKAANPSKIKLIINSLGGDVMIGLAIYNYLKSSGITVESEVIGFAASIASVMAMAGSPVKMAKNSFMIIHAAWAYGGGNASDMRKQAEQLDKVSNELADIYATKSGTHDAKYFTNAWAGGDVWLTASEAKDLGLVDEITGEVSMNASVDFSAFGLKNIPAGLQNSAEPPASFFTQLENRIMKIFDSLKASLTGAKETSPVANKEEILALVESVLTPFAQAIDTAIEEMKKPVEAEAVVTPAAATEPVVTPAASAPVVETPAPVVSAEAKKVAELEKQIEDLRASMANNITRPAADGSKADDILNKVKVEYAS